LVDIVAYAFIGVFTLGVALTTVTYLTSRSGSDYSSRTTRELDKPTGGKSMKKRK